MNETDIVPDLYAKIYDMFMALMEGDADLSDLLALISAGGATHADAQRLAAIVGHAASAALQTNIIAEILPDGKLYFNIADRTISPVLRESHRIVSSAAAQVQQGLNKRAGIGIKPIVPGFDEDKLRRLLNKITGAEQFESVSWLLGAPVQVFVQSIADEAVQENVEFHARAGLSPKIRRVAAPGCCEWCNNMAGTYDYPAPKDVYRRHERCNCTVTYDPGDSIGRVQNVWTKRWRDPDAAAKIEYRKTVGLREAQHGKKAD